MEQLAQPWGSEQQQQQEPQLTMEQQLQSGPRGTQ